MMTQQEIAHPAIYCRQCGYALGGLSENRCPECGRPFDPANRRTFARSGRSYLWRRWRRRAVGGLVLAVLLGGVFIAGRAIWVYQRYHAGWQAEQDALAALKAAGADVVYSSPRPWGYRPSLLKRIADPCDYLRDRAYAIAVRSMPDPAAAFPYLSTFRECTSVYLLNVGISDDQLRHLQGMAKLQHLDLWGNPAITDDGLVHLAGLASLRILDLDRTSVSGAGLKHLKGSTSLASLALRDSRGRGLDLGGIKAFPALRNLRLGGSTVTDADLAQLAGLPLRWLYLERTAITDAGLVEVGKMSRLEHLALSDTAITDAGLRHLSGLSALQTLYLHGTAVTDAGLKHLEALRNLSVLAVQGTEVTPEGIEQLKRAIPSLYVDGP